MAAAVAFVQGLFELAGLGSFLIGYFGDICCLVVLDDIIEMSMGVLNPLFPAAFKVLGIPTSLKKVFTPKQFVAQALQRTQG